MSGVSPGTVSLAFRVLRERGVITTSHGRRARVAGRPAVATAAMTAVPDGVRDLSTSSPDPSLLPDLGRLLTPNLYGRELYNTQIVEPTLGGLMSRQFQDELIDGPLTATSGALDALERVLMATTRPGDAVVVEDPVWTASLAVLRVLGLHAVGCRIDDEGLVPEELERTLQQRECAAVVVTPRAQNPFGSAMSAERADDLRAVLDPYHSLIVIEDDHANLIAGAPSVTVVNNRSRWAVIRSFSKALGPDLRLAIMASDLETAELVQGRLVIGPGWASHMTQRLVAKALSTPGILEEVAEAEAQYRIRREQFLQDLTREGVRGLGRSGLNVLVPVAEEADVVANLLLRGWAVRAGAPFRLRAQPFIRVTTASMSSDESRELARAIGAVSVGQQATRLV